LRALEMGAERGAASAEGVAARAQALIEGDCLLLDTETTGVGDGDEVCEITILDASGTPLLNTLVRPTQPIPAEATGIHHHQ
jgi:DNA polymerase III epsilon subunit-like protein